MKILIIGASGQIGGACMEILKGGQEVYGTYFSHPKDGLLKLDFTSEKEVSDLIGKIKPDAVILTAALTNVDFCETHPEEARKMNVDAVKFVAKACNTCNAKLVYISTDYVFDGKSGPYDEEATPNPISVYGKTKYEGELETKKAKEWLIIRTGNVFDFGFDEKNFVIRLIERLKAGEEVKVQNDLFATPTLATHIAIGISKLLEMGKVGIYNVAGLETITRYALALEVARYFKFPEEQLKGVSTAEFGQKAARPLKGGLLCKKLQMETGIAPLPLLDAFEIISKKMTGKDGK